jgi:hypothetical protein
MSRHVALSESESFVPIARSSRTPYDYQGCLQRSPATGANLIDDCSDWMSFHDALAHVEATQKCYQEAAIRLLQQAADSLEIRSRTVQGLPRWVVSGDKYYEDDGRDLQFYRKDVLKLWPEQQMEAAAPRRLREEHIQSQSTWPLMLSILVEFPKA